MNNNIEQIKANSTAEDIVKFYNTNLNGKVVIITGSNTGIGLETARVLASVGAKVIIPCRTLEKAEGAIRTIKTLIPDADLIGMQLDLSDISSIKTFAKEFLDLNIPLNILINNAGIMACPKSLTKDGFETQFGVNHLGHFLLVELLTAKLKASTPSRVVIVSSSGNSQFLSKDGIDFDNLNGEKGYSPFGMYGQSKLANILHAKELQDRFDSQNSDITVVSLHPGSVQTELKRHLDISATFNMFSTMRNYKTALREASNHKNVQVGASTNVYCAVSPDIVKSAFYSNNAINTDLLNEQANNKQMAKKLYEVSQQLLNRHI